MKQVTDYTYGIAEYGRIGKSNLVSYVVLGNVYCSLQNMVKQYRAIVQL